MLLPRRRFLQTSSLIGTSLLLAGKSMASVPTSSQFSRVAYVVGNAKYGAIGCGQSSCGLRSPEHDAEDVTSFLTLCGFKVVPHKNVSSTSFQKIVSDFSREAALFDVALFYYSGHAIQVDGENYLIPVDVKDIADAVIDKQLTPLRWAIDADAGPDTVGVIILDACRDNPFVNALEQSPLPVLSPLSNHVPEVKKGLAAVEPRDRFIVAYSTAADHVAADGDGVGLSPFTKAWLTLAKDSGSSVKDTFDRASTSVCDMTTPGAVPGTPARTDIFCQRPALYTSLGAVPIYWDDKADGEAVPSSPLLVSITMGRADDPAVQASLGNINQEFSFNYTWRPAVADRSVAKIIPDLDYFQTAEERGRPFVMASVAGYYSPEEGATGWTLSYPILDIIARKIQRDTLTIQNLVIESHDSRQDNAPYVDLLTPGTGCCALTMINNSWDMISKVDLEFDIVSIEQASEDDLRAYVDQRQDNKPYAIKYSTKDIDRYEDFDLSTIIEPLFPDVKYFKFAYGKMIEEDKQHRAKVTDLEKDKVVTKLPDGFQSWYQKNRKMFVPDDSTSEDGATLNIAGRMTSWSPRGDSQIADFAAMLSLIAPGVGGGLLEYNLREVVKLPIDGQEHVIRRPINKDLKKAGDVFRGVVALVPERSSYHRLRFSLEGASGTLYQSSWVDTHIVVSRNDKEAAIAAK